MNILQTIGAAYATKSAATEASTEDKPTNGLRSTIVDLIILLSNLHVAHWQASRKTNEHAALGGLYASLDGLIDDFAETLMGLEGNTDMPTKSAEVAGGKGFADVVKGIRTSVESLCKESKTVSDDLANVAADMTQAVNKACYLLEL